MTPPSSSEHAIDTAWRIHAALADWTGKVDAKASFTLTIESAVIGGVVVLSGGGHRLYNLEGFWTLGFYWLGVVLLSIAVLTAITVVMPRVRRRAVVNEVTSNFIYFGHLKDWDAGQLATALQTEDVLPVLSRQLVNMSKIAWTKHLRVQLSMGLAVLDTAAIVLAALVR